MDPAQLPNVEHVETTKGVLSWLGYIGSMVVTGWGLNSLTKHKVNATVDAAKREVLKEVEASVAPLRSVVSSLEGVPSSLASLQAAVDNLEDNCDCMIKAEYLTRAEFDKAQSACVMHIWDRLMLDLEKRDRARDGQIHEKISHICSGLAEVRMELQRLASSTASSKHNGDDARSM